MPSIIKLSCTGAADGAGAIEPGALESALLMLLPQLRVCEASVVLRGVLGWGENDAVRR